MVRNELIFSPVLKVDVTEPTVFVVEVGIVKAAYDEPELFAEVKVKPPNDVEVLPPLPKYDMAGG